MGTTWGADDQIHIQRADDCDGGQQKTSRQVIQDYFYNDTITADNARGSMKGHQPKPVAINRLSLVAYLESGFRELV